MKKILFATVAVTALLGSTTTFASGVGGFLQDAASTTSQVSNAVKGPTKLTTDALKNSGSKYINKSIQVSGNIVSMKMVNENSYTVIVRDQSNNEVTANTKKAPYVKLGSKVSVTGSYNGEMITAARISSGGSWG